MHFGICTVTERKTLKMRENIPENTGQSTFSAFIQYAFRNALYY